MRAASPYRGVRRPGSRFLPESFVSLDVWSRSRVEPASPRMRISRCARLRTGPGRRWRAGRPFPIILVLIVALFPAVQDRIDRNDPKLAQAPVRSEPLDFTDPPSAPITP